MSDSGKQVLRETLAVALGLAVCTAAMVGVFALLGRYDRTVLIGAVAGWLLAAGNFFFMDLSATMVTERAGTQSAQKGKLTMQGSMVVRLLVLFLLMLAGVKSGYCNILAICLPLAFIRPVVTLGDFFRKKDPV